MSAQLREPPFLSVCIPTHNRALYLGVLLESIASQMRPGVEIVISDDGSSDNTPELVDSFQSRRSPIRYMRFEPALRYDRNVLKVVEMARGDFCWLFGDDDRMEPGSLEEVLCSLKANHELTGMTVDRINYDHTYLARSQRGARIKPKA
jgi:abequosyltransferase